MLPFATLTNTRYCLINFNRDKSIMPLRCKGLLEVKENEATLLKRKDIKKQCSGRGNIVSDV